MRGDREGGRRLRRSGVGAAAWMWWRTGGGAEPGESAGAKRELRCEPLLDRSVDPSTTEGLEVELGEVVEDVGLGDDGDEFVVLLHGPRARRGPGGPGEGRRQHGARRSESARRPCVPRSFARP